MIEVSAAQVNAKIDAIFTGMFELKLDDIKPEANLFTDLGLDSLDAIDLVISFQKEFNIAPENEELKKIRTVGDVYGLVDKYFSKSTPTS